MSVQCSATKSKSKQRCKLRTKKGPMCWLHAERDKQLRVKKSQIIGAGDGLYATADIPKNKAIDEYKGKVTSTDPTDDSDYVLQVNSKKWIDAKKPTSCYARFANDCRTKDKKNKKCKGNNSKLKYNYKTNKANLVSAQKIKKGEEINTPYGRQYWTTKEKALSQ